MLSYPEGFIVAYRFEHFKLVSEWVSCDTCAFRDMRPNCPFEVVGFCDSRDRSDGSSIKFVKVPKPDMAVIRTQRLILAKNCCEYCGKPVSGMDEQCHHVIDKDEYRHDTYEALQTTRILCYDCHEGIKKSGEVKKFYRKEICDWLLLQYDPDKVRDITGRKIYI